METITVSPSMSDPDTSDTVTISAVISSGAGTQPSFVVIATDKLSFTVHPTSMSEAGSHTIEVSITDTKATVKTSFILNVTNLRTIVIHPYDIKSSSKFIIT